MLFVCASAGDEQPRRGGRLGFGSMGDEACGGGECVCVCGGGCGRGWRVGGGVCGEAHQKALPFWSSGLQQEKIAARASACESLPTAAHRCSRGASGRNKEFRVACFSHSTTMRETTVCYLRPKRGPTGKVAGRAARERRLRAALSGNVGRKSAFATILARGWLAAQASVMPPALPRPGLPRCECEVLVSYHPTVKRGSTFNKQESRVTACLHQTCHPSRS